MCSEGFSFGKVSQAAVRRCSTKSCSEKFRKIYRELPVPELTIFQTSKFTRQNIRSSVLLNFVFGKKKLLIIRNLTSKENVQSLINVDYVHNLVKKTSYKKPLRKQKLAKIMQNYAKLCKYWSYSKKILMITSRTQTFMISKKSLFLLFADRTLMFSRNLYSIWQTLFFTASWVSPLIPSSSLYITPRGNLACILFISSERRVFLRIQGKRLICSKRASYLPTYNLT